MSNLAKGVLKLTQKGSGVLRDPQQSLRRGRDDVLVPVALIREYQLVEGGTVTGPWKHGKHGRILTAVESICDLPPAEYSSRTPFARLTAIDPCDRFRLGGSGVKSMRVMDLIAPIGKGTRGMIVSPPKAGKTTMLEHIARAIREDNASARIIILLIDERPEEVTNFRRAVDAEVFSSSSDQSMQEHVDLVELILAHIRVELECGRDVVVLVDSLTRMARAFNLTGSGSSRTLSGGLTAGAIEIPRRFFGMARNIEFGGSVTIIATALVDTGSRMDQVIFEEFKGTGNSEIVLDRSLAEMRIFPAININESSTRKEACLFREDEYDGVVNLRRMLAGLPAPDAMQKMLQLIDRYDSNAALLKALAGKL